MFTKRHIMYFILVVLLLLVIMVALQAKPVRVDAAQVSYAPLQVSQEEEGKTRVIEHYIISAPVDAYLHRIPLNEGDSIQQGQVLFTLEPLPAALLDSRSRAQSEAMTGVTDELEKIVMALNKAALADKNLADVTYLRNTELRQKKVVSQNELDIAEAEKLRSGAMYQAARYGKVLAKYLSRMSNASLEYENTLQSVHDRHVFKVRSRSQGCILKIADKSERIVRSGTLLMELGDTQQIEVETEVLSTLAVQLRPGMPVEILRWGGEQVLQGSIKRIEPSGFTKISALGVEEQRVKVIVSINSNPDQRKQLGHGYRVESRFILWQADKVLQVPNSALFRDHKQVSAGSEKHWAVYVIKDNVLARRQVQIGHRNNLMTEVVSGLTEGEQVVAYLSNELQDGGSVELR